MSNNPFNDDPNVNISVSVITSPSSGVRLKEEKRVRLKEEKQQQQYAQFDFLQYIMELQNEYMGEVLNQRCILILQQLL